MSPYFPVLERLIHATRDPFASRFHVRMVYMEALPRRSSSQSSSTLAPLAGAAFEEPVAAALVQVDPSREDGTAYLSLLHCVNDEETLERLLGKVMEVVGEEGCMRLVGPTGPTPTWSSGALQNYFHMTPPLHTPYNPPYLPGILGSMMQPCVETALYHVGVTSDLFDTQKVAEIVPLRPAHLSGVLLPLLRESLRTSDEFLPPDETEAALILRWLGAYPLDGWLAEVAGVPVGFLLMQPDLAGLMKLTGGGRLWPWRWYADWRKQAPVDAGRVVLATVAPEWRGQGIGRQLWGQALTHARAMGWRTLTCGPVILDSPAAAFLERIGAQARQRYTTYAWTPW